MRYIPLAALVALSACSAGHSESRDDGPAGSRSFSVGTFDAVSLEGSDDVRVVSGPAVSVTATGPEGVLEKLDVRVDGNTLKIGRKRSGWGMNWSSGKGAVITVTTPGVTAAAVAGSGSMTLDRAAGEKFTGSIAGSGNLSLADVRVRDARFDLAGSGTLRASGAAEAAKLSIAGSGDIEAEGLASQTADILIAGSGNVRVAAQKSAKISLVGSGDATVKGTANCSVTKLGSGEAHCA